METQTAMIWASGEEQEPDPMEEKTEMADLVKEMEAAALALKAGDTGVLSDFLFPTFVSYPSKATRTVINCAFGQVTVAS